MDFITEVMLVVGALVSLVLEYVPWVRSKWEGLRPQAKRFLLVSLMFLVTLGLYGVSCWTTWTAWVCPDNDVLSFVVDLVLAVAANQGVHLATKRPRALGN